MPKLRFYASGEAMVVDIKAQDEGVRRFVGRRIGLHESGAAMFIPTEQPQEVDALPEYIRDCREGALEPADEATAKACGVLFKPHAAEPPVASKKKE